MSEEIKYKAIDFELYKSNICHAVKQQGELDFIEKTLINNDIEKYWNNNNYAYAFYTLAMLDYLSKQNNIPLYSKYDYIRHKKLKEPIYPLSALLIKKMNASPVILDKYEKNAIPEFAQYNIIEGAFL